MAGRESVRPVVAAIAAMETEELEVVVRAVRLRQQALRLEASMKFSEGDAVSFTSRRDGRRVTGVVRKVTDRWVRVLEDGGRTLWKVHPTLLAQSTGGA